MLKALRGTKDILPSGIAVWNHIESAARRAFSIYGYREIRTPIIEEASLFVRSIGDATDIVQKEMYVFKDRGGREIALRPEATASIARAFIENSLASSMPLCKLFYIGPMFRSERPQKGRYRQFHQLGVEAIGSDSPYMDAEVILLACDILKDIGIDNTGLRVNSLGCSKDKEKMMRFCRDAILPYRGDLCEECKARYKKNILRIFDCKRPRCREIASAVKLPDFLCNHCAAHFRSVKDALNDSGADFSIDRGIVRGLDYYTGTVFEIIQPGLGAKDAICAGGRYNNLIKQLGGKDTPAVGFAFGIERLALCLRSDFTDSRPCPDAFVVITGEPLRQRGFQLLQVLRRNGLSADMVHDPKSLKSQMRTAERFNASCVVIAGEEELNKDRVVIRDMKRHEQREVSVSDMVSQVRMIAGRKEAP